MSKLLDIWIRLFLTTLQVVWIKVRLLWFKSKWLLEDEVRYFKREPQTNDGLEYSDDDRIITPIQKEKGFI